MKIYTPQNLPFYKVNKSLVCWVQSFYHSLENIFTTKEYKSIPINSHFPFPQAPGHHRSTLFLWICQLWLFHVNGTLQQNTRTLGTSFFHSACFKVCPCCSMYQYFPLYCQITFHCRYMYYLLFAHLSINEHLDFPPLFDYYK